MISVIAVVLRQAIMRQQVMMKCCCWKRIKSEDLLDHNEKNNEKMEKIMDHFWNSKRSDVFMSEVKLRRPQ